MGFIGGAIRAFSGTPGVKVVGKVKSKPIQGLIDSAVSDYSAVRDAGKGALGDYIAKYLANTKDSSLWGDQEMGAVSDFYNGNMASRLQELRAGREKAINAAADVAGAQAIRSVNQSRLAGEGGPSSYDARLLAGALAPIRVNAALDTANQERADFGYLTGAQLDLIGRRAGIANQAAAVGLVPEMMRRQLYGQDLGFIGSLGQLDQMNKFYGLRQESNPWADFADSADQGILNAASIYSSVAGGGMGGGKKDGGMIHGPGTPTSDSININVSTGEYIMPAAAVKMPGVLPLLESIRQAALKDSTSTSYSGGRRNFASGGLSGQAMALQARADRGFFPYQWMPSNYGVPEMPPVAPPPTASGMTMPQMTPPARKPEQQTPWWTPEGYDAVMNWKPAESINAGGGISYDSFRPQPAPPAFGAPLDTSGLSYDWRPVSGLDTSAMSLSY